MRRAGGGVGLRSDWSDMADQDDPRPPVPAAEIAHQVEGPRLDRGERLAAGRGGAEVGLPAEQALLVAPQDLGAGEPLPLPERLLAQALLQPQRNLPGNGDAASGLAGAGERAAIDGPYGQ